jgi:2-C-methyl-D-erythritol 4-phosphate cytidylyltransferase
MTTALIFAGGTGIRMNSKAKPKQFLELHGKPVLIYTIEHFENHKGIDNIIVVCIEEWITELRHLLRQYMLDKVSQIVPGGDRGDISIYKGLRALEDVCKHDDIVLIHDGVRPLINSELISSNIAKTKECGNAITIDAATESIVRLNDAGLISDIPSRHDMYHAKAPQTFRFGWILDIYKRAFSEDISSYDSAHLCGIFGEKMYTVMSTPNNLKITTPADYYIFRALYEAMENEQIFGL